MPYVLGGELTDRSGSITAGGTSQEVAATNENRSYLLIQNVSSGDIWVDFDTPAVADQPSIKLIPNASIEFSASGTGFVPSGTINVLATLVGQKFVVKEVVG